MLSGLLLFAALVGFGADSEPVTRFVVLGDLHYYNCDDNGDPSSERVRRLKKDMDGKAIRYDFVLQVGDIVNCQTGNCPRPYHECREEWQGALTDVKHLFPDKSFILTPGNHDWYGGDSWQGGWPLLKEYYLTFCEKELGFGLNGRPFFHFRWNDCLFIVLNHMGMDVAFDHEQREMLEKTLSAAEADPAVSRVFAMSHPGLWNVNYYRFNENWSLQEVFAKSRKFDAYFCGHIHQNSVTARMNGLGGALRQICVAGTWPPWEGRSGRSRPLPTTDLNPPPSQRLFADYPADVQSYVVVAATRTKVNVRFEAVGGGTIGEYEWSTPVGLKAVKPAAKRFDGRLSADVRSARLWYFPFSVDHFLTPVPALRVKVNGSDIGELRRNNVDYEVNRGGYFLDIPSSVLRTKNEVVISNPSGERFLIRDLSIMATDVSGKEHFTDVYPRVLVFGDPHDFYMGFGLVHAGYGTLYSAVEKNIPEELLEIVPLSAAEARIRLDFE